MKQAEIQAFFDEATNTVSCLVWDTETRKAAVVNPMLDFDVAAGTASNRSVEEILAAAAHVLYRSVKWLLSLPDHTRLYLCHDYKAPGRDEYVRETTVAEERAHNVHVHDGVSGEAFVAMREARDAELDAPRLLLPSIQTNIRAGRFPPAEANGVHYPKIPVKIA